MIYFVGIHNKEGMLPLDSRTVSGKIIDRVIMELGVECKKLNLFPTECMPINYFERCEYVVQFTRNLDKSGTYVLLGRDVQLWLANRIENSISVQHPAYAKRKGNDYVNDFIAVLIKILSASKMAVTSPPNEA